jgi:hypothetical protein
VLLAEIAKETRVSNQELISGAVTHAWHNGWLEVTGEPISSVLLTVKGLGAMPRKR